MKGYELVLYANAILFLGFSFFALTYGIMLTHEASLCAEPTPTCERQAALGERADAVAPYLASIGTLLAGIAGTLTVRRVKFSANGTARGNL